MPIDGLDSERCAKRRYLAARRDGVETATLALLRQAPAAPSGAELRSARGVLPATEEEALQLINARLSEPLGLHQVWIHYAEAANSRFISDRFAFLGESTLRNIASGAERGVAFMNSHRVGGLSHPAELPFGRTFAGRYELLDREGQPLQRALVGLYMLRGVRPVGEAGPSTDDLHAMIQAGTVFDVSVGLREGEALCDVCGRDLYSRDCPHVPGTHRKMGEEERAAQSARGVREGRASYTYVDGVLGEVSAVYDGAVPGAGFNKFVSLERQGALSSLDLAESEEAYGDLRALRSPTVQAIIGAIADRVSQALQGLGPKPKPEEPAPEADSDPTGAEAPQEETMPDKPDELAEAAADTGAPTEPLDPTPPNPAAAEVEALRARAEAAERQAAELLSAVERRQVETTLTDLRVGEGRLSLTPASRAALTDALMALAPNQREPVLEALGALTLVELGERGFTASESSEAVSEARLRELLGATPLGQAVLAAAQSTVAGPTPPTTGKEE